MATAGGSFSPSDDILFTGQTTFTQTPNFGTGASTGAVVTTTGTQTLTNKTITSPSVTTPTIAGATVTGTVTIATGATITNPAIVGAAITGTVTIATGATLTNPAIAAAAITGVVTVASGATLTTPTVLLTVSDLIATGTTGSNAAAAPSVTPALVHANSTGVSGAGINLPTGACVPGAYYVIINDQTGAVNIYATGATINGTTGTTAYAITATGNRMAQAVCTIAGAWLVRGNT